jgi:hypothetical protein
MTENAAATHDCPAPNPVLRHRAPAPAKPTNAPNTPDRVQNTSKSVIFGRNRSKKVVSHNHYFHSNPRTRRHLCSRNSK